jgi:hypothetical protein
MTNNTASANTTLLLIIDSSTIVARICPSTSRIDEPGKYVNRFVEAEHHDMTDHDITHRSPHLQPSCGGGDETYSAALQFLHTAVLRPLLQCCVLSAPKSASTATSGNPIVTTRVQIRLLIDSLK